MLKFLQKNLFYVFLLLASLFLGYYAGKYIANYFSPKKSEQHAQIIQSIQSIAKISTYKIHQLEEIEWSNEVISHSKYFNFFNKISNLLYLKNLKLSAPVIATYGVDLDSIPIQTKFLNDSFFIELPETKLLHFEVLWNEKKIFSNKGLLVLENDHQFDNLEKLFYDEKIAIYKNKDTAFLEAKKILENQIISFFKNMGLNVKMMKQ